MKIKTAILLGVLLTVFSLLYLHPWRRDDISVAKAVSRLRKAQTVVPTKTQPAMSVVAEKDVASTVPESVLADAVAISSFFSQSELSSLSDEQAATLEVVLRNAILATYQLLLERGAITKMPQGDIRIEIPAQGHKLSDMRDYVYESIASIIGPEAMESFEAHSLGPRFDAKFAYFGEYDTTIALSIERPSAPGRSGYVTMRNAYDAGRIRSTHVIKLENFEREFFPLPGQSK